jgi:hypothetical protein
MSAFEAGDAAAARQLEVSVSLRGRASKPRIA